MRKEQKYKTFSEFWPFYLSQHSRLWTRVLHAIGLVVALGLLVAAISLRKFLWIVGVPVVGYGPAWFGHFFIEKNMPATFKNPVYSLIGDFKMFAITIGLKQLERPGQPK